MMKNFLYLIFVLVFISASPVFAGVEPNYKGGGPLVTTPWFGHQSVDNQNSDMNFIAGMRPHHAGALSMSKEYLADKKSSNEKLKSLARGIIANQTFEIGMLNKVEELVKKPIVAPKGHTQWRQIAEHGLAQKQKFVRASIPNSFGIDKTPVTKRDVEFAKAMVVHHEGALTMCHGYLNNPSTANKYLQLLCVDILKDQAQEIALMNKITTFYPGNPDDVKINSSMVHGMEGMNHGNHGHDDMKMDKKSHQCHCHDKKDGKKSQPMKSDMGMERMGHMHQ